MPYFKAYIHFVWSTKNRYSFLCTRDLRESVWQHIRENAKQKNIHVDTINGYSEHFHCLISLNPEITVSRTLQLLKGESSWWINKHSITKEKFEWQDEYFGVAVTHRALDNARKYILNQEEHHKRISFEEEYDRFLRDTGFNTPAWRQGQLKKGIFNCP